MGEAGMSESSKYFVPRSEQPGVFASATAVPVRETAACRARRAGPASLLTWSPAR